MNFKLREICTEKKLDSLCVTCLIFHTEEYIISICMAIRAYIVSTGNVLYSEWYMYICTIISLGVNLASYFD